MKLIKNTKNEVILNTQDLEDLDYILSIIYTNQNSHGDPELDKQSVRAYKLINKLFKNHKVLK